MSATPSTIPDTQFEGIVRAYDPDTSWDAAAHQTRTKTQRLRAALAAIFDVGGDYTDDELGAVYSRMQADNPDRYDRATPQSVRTRRKELAVAGVVVETGAKRQSANDHPSRVWVMKS